MHNLDRSECRAAGPVEAAIRRSRPRSRPFTRARGRALRALAPLAIGIASGACFVYVPVEPQALRPEEEVRIVVSSEAAQRLVREYGAGTSRMEGELTPMGGDSLAFALWVGKAFVGTDFSTARQTIPLSRNEVLEVYRRQFSVKRTTLFTLGVAVGAAILINRLTPGNPGIDDGDDPPPPPELLRVIWRK